jgi:type IV secretion system protein VirB9
MKKESMKHIVFLMIIVTALFSGCQTVHFDETTDAEPAGKSEGVTSLEEEIRADEQEQHRIFVEEELKTLDVEKTIVYVDRPVYSPVEPENQPLEPKDAVARSLSNALQVPLKFVNGVMYYPWDETFVYEIHTQPYRTTDIILEPGEEVLEMPFLSEEKVWEIGAGVSRKNGLDVQHFFAKPSISGLTTSMIIITDRRVYHLILKSFRDRYMVMVQWNYPPAMPFHVKSDSLNSANTLNRDLTLVDPAFLSFDYRMTYSIFRKPAWLPVRVYDDGRKTYIQLNERVLHTESPVLFNRRNERINYRVHKNLIIIDELIEKVTLRRGNEKVTVYKKRYARQQEEQETQEQEEAGT